jgi:hypothetical protein
MPKENATSMTLDDKLNQYIDNYNAIRQAQHFGNFTNFRKVPPISLWAWHGGIGLIGKQAEDYLQGLEKKIVEEIIHANVYDCLDSSSECVREAKRHFVRTGVTTTLADKILALVWKERERAEEEEKEKKKTP